jgi:hypothetical protein
MANNVLSAAIFLIDDLNSMLMSFLKIELLKLIKKYLISIFLSKANRLIINQKSFLDFTSLH